MKYWMFLVISLFVFSCCEPCEEVDENFIVSALSDGYVVDVDGREVQIDGEIVGALPVVEHRSPVVTEGCFGFDWCVKMNGSKGRAIATAESIHNYMEAGSEQYPSDLTSVTYFSKNFYPNYDDSDVNHLQLRGKVAAWGAGWNNARVDWCEIDHPLFCVQEE